MLFTNSWAVNLDVSIPLQAEDGPFCLAIPASTSVPQRNQVCPTDVGSNGDGPEGL